MPNEVLVKVSVDGDPSSPFKQVDDAAAKATGNIEKTAKAAGGLSTAMKGVATAAGGFVVANVIGDVAGKVMGFVNDSIKASTNLGESINAVNKIFGDSSKQILDWGKNNATTFGLSAREFNQLAVPLGAIFKNTGIEMDKTTDFTIKLTERAADMASVFNVDVGEALEAIQSGLRGEANPLERFGVGLSAARVEAHALAMTGKDVASSLTEQEKMLARVDMIMQQTADTQGDFKDTSDGLANSQRILAARNEELQAKIGDKLVPVMLKITEIKLALVNVLVSKVIPAFDAFSKYIGIVISDGDTLNDFLASVPEPLQGIAKAIGEVVLFIKNHWSTINDIFNFVFEYTKARVEGMIQVISSIVEIVTSVVNLVSALFHGDWARAWQEMKDIAGAIVDLLIGYVKMQFGTLPEILAGLASDAGRAFLGALESAFNEVKSFVSSIPGTILDLLAELPTLLIGLGRQLIEGLIEGIKRKLGPLRDVVNEAIGIIKEVGDFFGVRSPSTVFAMYGRSLMDGLIQGLNAREDNLKREVEDIIRLVGAVTGREVFEDLSIGTGASTRRYQNMPQGAEAEEALAHAIRMGYNTSGITVNMNNATVYARDEDDARRGAGDVAWALVTAVNARGMKI